MTAHRVLLLPLLAAACEVPTEGGSDKGSGDELCTFEEVDPIEQGWTEDQVSRATAAMQALPGSWSGNIGCDDDSLHPFRIDVQHDEEAQTGFQALTEDTRATCDTSTWEYVWTSLPVSVELDGVVFIERATAEVHGLPLDAETEKTKLCVDAEAGNGKGGCMETTWSAEGPEGMLWGWVEYPNDSCRAFDSKSSRR